VRSVSEPSLQLYSSNFTRDRSRVTDLKYERGKDKLAHWIGAWGYEEVKSKSTFSFCELSTAHHVCKLSYRFVCCSNTLCQDALSDKWSICGRYVPSHFLCCVATDFNHIKVMESVPHRDLLYGAAFADAKDHRDRRVSILDQGFFRPLSTPTSRRLTASLSKSRMIEVSLYDVRILSLLLYVFFCCRT